MATNLAKPRQLAYIRKYPGYEFKPITNNSRQSNLQSAFSVWLMIIQLIVFL